MSDSVPTFAISTSDLTPLFSFLTLLVTTFGAVALAFVAYLQAKIMHKTDVNTDITRATHESTNSKMDRLMQLIASEAEAKGRLAAIEERAAKDNRDDAA